MQDGSRRRARLVLIIGIVLALVAGAGTFFYASSATTTTAPVIQTTPVLVAAREIPAKTALTAGDLKVQEFNLDAKPAAALSKPEDAIGKIVIQNISIGEPILPTKFSDPKAPTFVVIPTTFLDANGAIKSDTPNFRAMSITVSDAFAVGGALQPGDVVDLMFTLQFDPARFLLSPDPKKQNADFSAKIILERIPLLARTGNVYTIRVDTVTAERIAYIQASGGTMAFILRAPKDERAAGTTGVTFGDVEKAYQIKIPEKFQP